MDASQYKDYVLFMLFIKYVTDKYADSGDFAPPVSIPEGASFNDMVKLKGKPDIGDKINTQIIQPLIEANDRLARSDFPDFNDPNKLGEGKAMVDRLTDLISIFQKPELNFAKNRAEHDDILGDAYEYLMRHFASESGKSKGQFYTPSEVSRILAQVLGIGPHNTTARTVAYDPTCGSGSLLLKVAAEAGKHITLEGQEKDVSTAGLARMNMILHDFPAASIMQGNTLANPKFKNGEQLRTYDYVVANPPFSDKAWSTGIALNDDLYQRFSWGVPPAKQGDYAYLLHVVRSMNSTGKAAIILPHGVLFRGNAEAVIRKQLVRSGYLKGIIGFPANLFYGTGIPACVLVLDKENAQARKGIFMLDAAKGFIKDGNKNRLREQDIHRIVDTFNTLTNVPGYARMVPFDEISGPKNDYNLNLPRYIDTSEPEDLHDIHAHLNGGIPVRDIDGDASALPPIPGLSSYWQALPGLRQALFKPNAQAGYADLAVESGVLKTTILEHPEFASFRRTINGLFAQWREQNTPVFKAFDIDNNPKELITKVGEDLLETFRKAPLLDPYDIYQHLMDYWAETLQDDTYEITADGWVVKPKRIVEEITSGKKKGQTKDKGWACDLIPKPYIVARYFSEEQATLDALQAELESTISRLTELEEEHGGDEGVLRDVVTKGDAQEDFIQTILDALKDDDPGQHAHYTQLKAELDTGESELAELSQFACMAPLKNAKGKLALKDVKSRHNSTGNSDEKYVLGRYLEADKASKQNSKQLKALLNELEAEYRTQLAIEPLREQLTDLKVIADYLELTDKQAELKKDVKEQDAALDLLAYNQYAKLSVEEIKTLVVNDKWLAALEALVKNELERVSQTLTGRVRQLADRYAAPLPELTQRVEALSAKVDEHLKKMGASWA
jgi:type I restriction enzyme M protein